MEHQFWKLVYRFLCWYDVRVTTLRYKVWSYILETYDTESAINMTEG